VSPIAQGVSLFCFSPAAVSNAGGFAVDQTPDWSAKTWDEDAMMTAHCSTKREETDCNQQMRGSVQCAAGGEAGLNTMMIHPHKRFRQDSEGMGRNSHTLNRDGHNYLIVTFFSFS